MKVLMVHNYYQQRGGEDESFDAEVAMLRAADHEVIQYTRHNRDVAQFSRAGLAAATIWNRRAAREVKELCRQHQPDVMHCTNTFPLFSPAIYYAAKSQGVAVVQALRNYRLLCANASFYRDGEVCQSCLTKKAAWTSLRHGCYRGSRAVSGVVTTMQAVHRAAGTWRRAVDLFFTPSQFTREKFIEAGFPADRIEVKPNFIDPDPGVGNGDGGFALFVGRLSEEKGVQQLLAQWEQIGAEIPLKIVGEGPLDDLVASAAARHDWLTWEGHQPLSRVLQWIGQATCVVMPSLWYETFGRVIIEAFAKGTPALVSDLGAMAELVEPGVNGFRFNPHQPGEMHQQVKRLLDDPQLRQRMGQQARRDYETRFTAEANYPVLMEIYRRACGLADQPRTAVRAASIL